MSKYAIAIHGGASEETSLLQSRRKEYEESMAAIVQEGYQILQNGGAALDAVETCVKRLEDNPLYNAGRGSVLNSNGEVEMDASIMDGHSLKAGAVSMVPLVKNPVSLARRIMSDTRHVMLSGYGALELAEYFEIACETASYFITDYQYQQYLKASKEESFPDRLKKKTRGTVGAVALDTKGNIAAATSTGGTANSLPGRVGDSCIIGAGCYANNQSCAVSGTGEGEALITNVVAHSIAMLVEYKQWPLQKACDFIIRNPKKPDPREMGVIAISSKGEVCVSFNTEIMKRAWITPEGEVHIKIYP